MPDSRATTVRAHLARSARTFEGVLAHNLDAILQAADLLITAFTNGGKLLLCGNGGSAADAQHMAAELVSRLRKDRQRPALPALALTTDTSFLTAYANDVDFAGIFARQVEAHGMEGDVLIGITTSGSSSNVKRAFEEARKRNMRTIALTGAKGVDVEVDCVVAVPGDVTQSVQEAHLAIEHILCELVEDSLYPA